MTFPFDGGQINGSFNGPLFKVKEWGERFSRWIRISLNPRDKNDTQIIAE